MTIQEINLELSKTNVLLATTQEEFEQVLADLAPALNEYEQVYNSALLQIVAQHKVAGTKEPNESTKAAICESQTEMLRLSKRVLEFRREALKSRLATLTTQMTSLMAQAKMVQEELAMERYKPKSVGTF